MKEVLRELSAAIAAYDDERAEAAAQAAGREGEGILPVLEEWLASEERDRRWWAVRTLAALGTPRAATLLIDALEDPEPDVRACAVVGLAGLRPDPAIEPLVERLSDPSAYVARLAADGLSRFGAPAVPALIEGLQSEDVARRAGAARALCAIQSTESIPALYAALDDPSAFVSYYAEEGLRRMGVGMIFFEP